MESDAEAWSAGSNASDCSAGRGVSREVKPSRMDVQLHLARTEIIVIVCLILMYIWPGMTLWLPNFLYGG